jgi:DNA-binding beta-propeller fold protein YncE
MPALLLWGAASAAGAGAPQPGGTPAFAHRFVERGIVVDTTIDRIEADNRGPLTSGDDVKFRFAVTDEASGGPVRGAYPAAWMDWLAGPEDRQQPCSDRVRRLLGGGLFSQAELDLNVYYVLALNHDPTITVVDPLFGFGGTKLLALIPLEGPGEDWVIDGAHKRVYVSQPDANAVAAIDTDAWQTIDQLDVGYRPTRVALQPDEAYLWVAIEETTADRSGVAVVRLDDLEIVARIRTGAGSHDIAFTPDSAFAFITNHDAASVTVIEIGRLNVVKQLDTAPAPVSIDVSDLAGAVYVAHADGTIATIDARTHEVVARTHAPPGLVQIRVAPGGRFALAPSSDTNTVSVFDTTSKRVIQTAHVLAGPDQIAFTDENAYVRHRGSEVVLIIPLDELGRAGEDVSVVDFPGGRLPFGQTSRPSIADGIVQASGEYGVLIANPADETIYYYKEGMAAPMGNFGNYGRRQPRAVMVVERNLRETAPGVYETAAALRRPGEYQLVFYLDAPRIVRCIDAAVASGSSRVPEGERPAIRIEPLVAKTDLSAGEPVTLTFRLTENGAAVSPEGPVRVLVFSPPWQRRTVAEAIGEGVFAVEFTIPRPGFYTVHVGAPSASIPPTRVLGLTVRP